MSSQSRDELAATNAAGQSTRQMEKGDIEEGQPKTEDARYPGPVKISLIMVSLSLAVFLYGLVSNYSFLNPCGSRMRNVHY
jgi:YbbR domain-containing protein